MGKSGAAAEAPHTGTTIVAVQYDGGVVVGADSRVSTGASHSQAACFPSIYIVQEAALPCSQHLRVMPPVIGSAVQLQCTCKHLDSTERCEDLHHGLQAHTSATGHQTS
jgi:Proteasome subunit